MFVVAQRGACDAVGTARRSIAALVCLSARCTMILTSLHTRTADDLFGTAQGSPRSERLMAASVRWAERILEKIDERFCCKE